MKVSTPLSATAAALTAVLVGCAGTREPAPNGYSFAYVADNREELGLVQVFDDGVQTYLQLPKDGDLSTRVLDEHGHITTPIRNGAYLVVPGVHVSLTLERVAGVSHIAHQATPGMQGVSAGSAGMATRDSGKGSPYGSAKRSADGHPTANAARQATTPSALANTESPSESATLQVLKLQNEVLRLQEQIAQQQLQLESARLTEASQVRGEIFFVHFANNSARPELPDEELEEIVKEGRGAETLVIEGYTDAFYPNEAGANLAQARARNVAAMLASGGIRRDAMTIGFHAAGAFARDNMTDDGKAFNRRVAITVRASETISPG